MLQEDKKLYKWQYQKSNRLDENLRIATLIRDNYTCQKCGRKDCILEVHHITPKRLGGNNSIYNLITLCNKCHKKVNNKEELYIKQFYQIIKGKNINYKDAQHVMQGKSYLRNKLNKITKIELTTGGDTSNRRIDWNIEKSHSNDAIVITNLKSNNIDIKEWLIKPMRRKSKAKCKKVERFKHRDLVSYTNIKEVIYIGYVTAMYPDKKQINIQAKEKHLKRCNAKKCKLIWRFNKIYWLNNDNFI
jgi:hypothetical protein